MHTMNKRTAQQRASTALREIIRAARKYVEAEEILLDRANREGPQQAPPEAADGGTSDE